MSAYSDLALAVAKVTEARDFLAARLPASPERLEVRRMLEEAEEHLRRLDKALMANLVDLYLVSMDPSTLDARIVSLLANLSPEERAMLARVTLRAMTPDERVEVLAASYRRERDAEESAEEPEDDAPVPPAGAFSPAVLLAVQSLSVPWGEGDRSATLPPVGGAS